MNFKTSPQRRKGAKGRQEKTLNRAEELVQRCSLSFFAFFAPLRLYSKKPCYPE